MEFKGIMKVQIPVTTNATGKTGLAYNQGRSVLVWFDPQQVADRMGSQFPESHKQFFHCVVDNNGKLTIGALAEWQDW